MFASFVGGRRNRADEAACSGGWVDTPVAQTAANRGSAQTHAPQDGSGNPRSRVCCALLPTSVTAITRVARGPT